jgi:hypothetical protein
VFMNFLLVFMNVILEYVLYALQFRFTTATSIGGGSIWFWIRERPSTCSYKENILRKVRLKCRMFESFRTKLTHEPLRLRRIYDTMHATTTRQHIWSKSVHDSFNRNNGRIQFIGATPFLQ